MTRRSGAIAFVLSEPQERLFEDPNFSVLLRAPRRRWPSPTSAWC